MENLNKENQQMLEAISDKFLKMIVKLPVNRFNKFVYSIVLRGSEDLSKELVSFIEPEKREDLIEKANHNFEELTVAEVIHLAHTLGDDPVERVSALFPFVHPKGFLTSDVKAFFRLYQYKPQKHNIEQTRKLFQKQLKIVMETEKIVEELRDKEREEEDKQ